MPNAAGHDPTTVETPALAGDAPTVEGPTIEGPAVESPTVESPTIESPSVDAGAGDAPPGDGPAGETTDDRRLAWRRRGVVALVVLTTIGVLASTLGIWVRRNIYDTDTWVATVQDLPANPAVAEALATRLTDEIVEATNATSRVRDLLPSVAAPLAAPITSALQGVVHDAVVTILTSDQFQTAWVAVNRVAHQQIVSILQGGEGVLHTDDGKVALNLLPIISTVLAKVNDISPGLIGSGTPPRISDTTPVDQAVAQLSAYLGRPLPPDFGQITVFESDQLAAAQNALKLFSRAVTAIIIVTVLLAGAAIALSTRRRRTALQLGLGAATAMAVAWALGRAITRQLIDGIADAQTRDATREVLVAVTSGLRSLSTWVLVVGAAIAVVAFLLGDGRSARWVRHQAQVLADPAKAAASPAGPVAVWVADHEAGTRVGGLVAGLAVLLVVDLSWSWLFVVAIALGAWQLAVTMATRTAAVVTPTP